MGRIVLKGNVIYLDTGDWLIRTAQKFCHNCGKIYKFQPPKSSFDELVNKARKQGGGLTVS